MSRRKQSFMLATLALHMIFAVHAAAAVRVADWRATNAPAALAVSTLKALAQRDNQRRAANPRNAKPRHPTELIRDVRDRLACTPDRLTKAN